MGAAPVKRRCVICHATYGGGEAFCSLDGGAIVAAGEGGDDDLVGTTVDGRYLITRLLGRGGMGKVYEAEHVGLGKRVALKFVSDADADREQRARFRQEARAASKVVDQHVVQIFDVGLDAAGRDYIAMEYVDGRDLDTLLREGPLAPARAIAITQQILSGLEAVHAAGIVHRDIKPTNIRIANDGVKIMDFGIAKAIHGGVAQTDTGTGRVIGTPEFMAPEQIQDRSVDHRADLYAVGATLYAMLAGAPPFGTNSSFTQRIRALEAPIPSLATVRPDLPASLVAAVARALEPAPDDRFSDAAAFASALRDGAAIAGARMEAETVRKAYPGRPAPAPERRRWIPIAALLAAGAIAATLYALSRPAARGTAPRADAALVSLPHDAAAVAVVPVVPVDAAPPDAAPPIKAAPVHRPAPPPPPVATGPACACNVTLATGSISRACLQKGAEPRCTCEDESHSGLCPVVKTVTNGSKERLPDGSHNGTIYCIDRTRPECDPLTKMPASCSLLTTAAVHGAPCHGYLTGQVESDPQTEGHYRCNVCDWAPTAPKFHGKTGDVCSGFEVTTGDKVSGVLECPKPP